MMTKDKEVEGLLNQLGELDQEITSFGKEKIDFAPKLLKSFDTEAAKASKLFPQPLAGEPASQIDAVHMAMNSAVEAGVLPDQFACPPIQDDDDLLYFTAKLSALNKDRGLARDLKDFLASAPSGLPEESAPEPEPVSRSPERMSRMMDLEMKRRKV